LNDKFTLCLGKKIRSLSEAEVTDFFRMISVCSDDLNARRVSFDFGFICITTALRLRSGCASVELSLPSTSLRVNLRLRSGNKKIRSLSEAEVPDFFE
jgi:pilus assembly protein TadC